MEAEEADAEKVEAEKMEVTSIMPDIIVRIQIKFETMPEKVTTCSIQM